MEVKQILTATEAAKLVTIDDVTGVHVADVGCHKIWLRGFKSKAANSDQIVWSAAVRFADYTSGTNVKGNTPEAAVESAVAAMVEWYDGRND